MSDFHTGLETHQKQWANNSKIPSENDYLFKKIIIKALNALTKNLLLSLS